MGALHWKKAALPGLVLVLVLAGGCSSEAGTVEPDQLDLVSTSPQATAAQVEKPPATLRYSLNKDPDTTLADNRVIGGPNAFAFYDEDELKGGDLFRSGAQAESKVQVFTASGPVAIGFSPTGGEKDTLQYSIAVQQDPESSLLAVTGARVRLPAQGLAPERYQLQVNVHSLGGSVENTILIDAIETSHIQAIGLFGDKVIVRSTNGDRDSGTRAYVSEITGYSALSGEELWSNPSLVDSSGGGSTIGVLNSASFDRSPDGSLLYGDLAGLTALDPATGAEKWVRPGPRVYLGSPEPGGTFPVRIVESNGASAHDFSDGSILAPDGVSYAIDREQNLLAVSYVYRGPMSSTVEVVGGGPAFEVIDLENGDVLYDLPAAEGLKHTTLEVLAAFDGLIWVQSGPDVSVIQASTGELSPNSASLSQLAGSVPRYRGDTWLVLGDRRVPRTFLWNAAGKFSLSDISES